MTLPLPDHWAPESWFSFTLPGEPVSKSRARFTGRGYKTRAYTPEKTRAAEEQVAKRYREAGGRFEADKEVTFAVDLTFYNGTRHRRDVDNMIKLVLDGLNGVAWVDDTQVMEVAARKRFVPKGEERTEISLAPIGEMERMTRICEECGVTFITYASWGNKRHCSMDCTMKQRRLARRRTCLNCGITWDPGKPSEAKYCSRKCRNEYGRVAVKCGVCGVQFETARSWANKQNYCSDPCRRKHDAEMHRQRRTVTFPGTCLICGSGTTRKEYRRCNPCKLAGIEVPE